MYHGKKISVAMATYNGATFIEKQLNSILTQTVVPDEIVISDDGSKDTTLEIVEKAQKAGGHQIIVITDNPRHGIGGNFEWAITHTTGDYIFICGQDDIWLPEKVEHVISSFLRYPNAEMICHELNLVDSNDIPIKNRTAYSIFRNLSDNIERCEKAERNQFLEAAISSPLISGTAICISSELVKKCMPIPVDSAEDQWLQFCAVADDKCYYLNEILTSHRMHDSASNSVGMKLHKRVRKVANKIRTASKDSGQLVKFSDAVINYLDTLPNNEQYESAYRTARRISDIGNIEIEAVKSGRIVGAYKLTKMYCTDLRYRRLGAPYFMIHLLNLLIYSKRKRFADLEGK
ncbi:MAG: glycosyltransferase [Ruminococcus sp.]|nr:glycosyltransferase [Ruminococcus sp.]